MLNSVVKQNLWIVRHGLTVGNIMRIAQGQKDFGLTDIGEIQAK